MIKLVVDETDNQTPHLIEWVEHKAKGKEYLVNLVSKQNDTRFCEIENITRFPTLYLFTQAPYIRVEGFYSVIHALGNYFDNEFKNL